MASPSSQSTEWLQERLVEILNSPHISFKKPAGLTNIRMGPGPIDLFSTRFANTVTSDVKGTVAGKEVDKEGLKEALLALQKKWNADSVLFKPQTSTAESKYHLVTAFEWAPKNSMNAAEYARREARLASASYP